MEMTANEIRRNYLGAKNKREQIKILADLNMCPRSKIEEIINGQPEKEMWKRLDEIDTEIQKHMKFIAKLEDEYREVVAKMKLASKEGA